MPVSLDHQIGIFACRRSTDWLKAATDHPVQAISSRSGTDRFRMSTGKASIGKQDGQLIWSPEEGAELIAALESSSVLFPAPYVFEQCRKGFHRIHF